MLIKIEFSYVIFEDIEIDASNLEENDEQNCSDIRDIEFKLMHNLNELQVRISSTSNKLTKNKKKLGRYIS